MKRDMVKGGLHRWPKKQWKSRKWFWFCFWGKVGRIEKAEHNHWTRISITYSTHLICCFSYHLWRPPFIMNSSGNPHLLFSHKRILIFLGTRAGFCWLSSLSFRSPPWAIPPPCVFRDAWVHERPIHAGSISCRKGYFQMIWRTWAKVRPQFYLSSVPGTPSFINTADENLFDGLQPNLSS